MEPTIDLDALYLAQVTLNCLPLVLCGECTSRMAVQPLQARLGAAWVSFLHHLAKERTAVARMAGKTAAYAATMASTALYSPCLPTSSGVFLPGLASLSLTCVKR